MRPCARDRDRVAADRDLLRERLDDLRADRDKNRTSFEDVRRTLGETRRDLEHATSERDEARRVADRTSSELQATSRDLERARTSDAVNANEVRRLQEQESALRQAVVEKDQRIMAGDQMYDELQNRRSVRSALALARVTRPLFRAVRGGARGEVPEPSPAAPVGAEEPAAPAALSMPTARTTDLGNLGDVVDRPETDPVTIVVPIYNAFDDVKRCVEALAEYTTSPAHLLLIDDASTDERVSGLLETFAGLTNTTVLRNNSNLGYTATVNRGVVESAGDVVLLNSDARVTPGWLERMRLTARLNPTAGTITAMSNNAGAFSAPEIGTNPIPLSLTEAEIGRLVGQGTERIYPSGPTGNGFCMYMRRTCIDEIGVFDADAFPRGYGEENDFCMRALHQGWTNIVDDSDYVFHTRSASFGEEKARLIDDGRRVVDERFPDYTARVHEFVHGEPMDAARRRVGDLFSTVEFGHQRVRPRGLFVLHEAGGGTPATNRDLMVGLSDRIDPYVLTSNARELKLSRVVDGELIPLDTWKLDRPIEASDTSRDDYRDVVASILLEYSADFVHIRHLISHTFDLPRVASELGIPVIYSLHDYYMVCPTVHLIDDKGVFCGGSCTAGQGDCWLPTPWLETLPHVKHDWVYEWRRRVEHDILPYVDAFVTTSPSVHEMLCRTYPVLADADFRIIEHGRDLEPPDPPVVGIPQPGAPVRVLLPGNLAPHKGIDLVKAISDLDTENRIEFHIIGSVPPGYELVGINHGPYERDHFMEQVRSIRPSFIGVLSTFGETYSHVVTEAWAAGVPVLGTGLGAVKERIEAHGGGWIIDHRDPQHAYDQIVAISSDPAVYEEGRSTATLNGVRTVAEMTSDYANLYADIAQVRRPFHFEDASAVLGRRVLRVGALVAGEAPRHPASVHIRTLLRLHHPTISNRIVTTVVDIDRFLDGARQDFDIMVVQRTAIPPERTADFVEVCRDLDIAIVFDIDDDLWALPPESDEYAAYQPALEGLEALARNADAVTVSTQPLHERMQQFSDSVVTVPNSLDERLWFSGLTTASDSRPWASGGLVSHEAGVVKILYYGTATHRLDLELFQPALEAFRARSGLDVRFVVAGGQPSDDQWFERMPIPPNVRHYPDFVLWLRETAREFDFGVAPLVDNTFNASKSDLKYLEFAAIGLPAIYSNVPSFASVTDGETGLLATTQDEWVECLSQMAADRDRRDRIRSNAYDDVVEHRLLGPVATGYFDELLRIAPPSEARVDD